MTFRSIALPLLLLSAVLGTWYGPDFADQDPPETANAGSAENKSIATCLSSTLEEVVETTDRLDCLERILKLKRRLKEKVTMDLVKGHLALKKAIEGLRDIDKACAIHSGSAWLFVPGVKSERDYYCRQLMGRVSELLSRDDDARAATLSRLQQELAQLSSDEWDRRKWPEN